MNIEDLKALFEETQNLPQSKLITEEEIEAEILAYREGILFEL